MGDAHVETCAGFLEHGFKHKHYGWDAHGETYVGLRGCVYTPPNIWMGRARRNVRWNICYTYKHAMDVRRTRT